MSESSLLHSPPGGVLNCSHTHSGAEGSILGVLDLVSLRHLPTGDRETINRRSPQWRSQRGANGPSIPYQISMVGNGVPITGCLSHRVTTYNGFQDASVRFSFPTLSFPFPFAEFFHNSNRIQLGIL